MKNSHNSHYKNISKKELFNKLSKLSSTQIKNLGFNNEEINYLKNKILNDKLGLVLNFEEKDEYLENHYFGLEEIENLHINPKDKNNNLLIEGDNYYALKALQVAGIKVNVIYIDPPYNTGNKDFIYNDKIVDKDDQYKHSKWLSFMKKRLILARELMADDGVIFVSIDDNEQAYLKVLMDEIFGEENFITNFVWERTFHSNKNSSGKKVFRNADYILCYSKTKSIQFFNEGIKNNFEDAALKNNTNKEKEIIFPKHSVFLKWSNKWNEEEIKIIFKSRWSQEKINSEIDEGTKFIIKKSDDYSKIRVLYNENKIGYKIPNQLLNTSDIFVNKLNLPTTERGTRELEKLALGNLFSYPKPVELMKYLLILNNNKNSTILDFFAGSGTTAQAVMELNEEDSGNRRFILCTNNENNIAKDICRERIYRVINGEGSKKEKIDWEYSKDKKSLVNNSMKYLEVKSINSVNGEYEEINSMKKIYKDEFNKELTIKDFK